MSTTSGKAWFAAKAQGYGSGWPIAWQGWAVLAIFVSVTVAAAFILPRVWQLIVIGVGAAIVLMVAARTTEGGWRWRGD